MGKPILCVDFDGVIHSYTTAWKGVDVIPDPPVPGAVAWLVAASQRFDVAIYSSRSKTPEGIAAMRAWFEQHGPEALPHIRFAHEKPAAFLTIDDRALTFDGDFTHFDPDELIRFRPWNKG